MKAKLGFRFLGWVAGLLAWAGAAVVSARADEVSETIARARAYAGPEAALDAVTSIRYTGVLTTTGENTGENKVIPIEIIFQKPYRQRIVARYPDKIDTTALDDYEGWNRIEDVSDRSRWRLTLLNKDQIVRLRVNTWEMLSFYKGLERKGGRIEDRGVVTLEGRQARKLAFMHDHGIYFLRYFDVETGRLLLSETEQGGTIRDEGEIMVEGIRFPKTTVTTSKTPSGMPRSISITFDSIAINEHFADEVFAVPMGVPGGAATRPVRK